MKVCIIGAGASGIMCALNISKKYDVLLIDKDDIGKKLLVTGNGRCNFFHDPIDLDKYVTDDPIKLKKIFKYSESFKYLEDLGIHYVNKNGNLYPYSLRSESIRDIFLENLNIKFKKVNVFDIVKKDKFIINPGKENIRCDKIVLALGSNVYTGTNIMEKLLKNYNFKPFKPALVSVKTKETYPWKGIRCQARVRLYAKDFIKEEVGEIQLTDYGISGICIFNLSLYLKENSYFLINFLNDIDIIKYLDNDRPIKYNLLTFLNKRLINIILKKSNINNESYREINKKKRKILIDNLTKFRLDVVGPYNYKSAQSALGGLSLKEINDDFSLKKDKNIYVIGEALDVTGQCGGYNLAFAFTSGYICGREI